MIWSAATHLQVKSQEFRRPNQKKLMTWRALVYLRIPSRKRRRRRSLDWTHLENLQLPMGLQTSPAKDPPSR